MTVFVYKRVYSSSVSISVPGDLLESAVQRCVSGGRRGTSRTRCKERSIVYI